MVFMVLFLSLDAWTVEKYYIGLCLRSTECVQSRKTALIGGELKMKHSFVVFVNNSARVVSMLLEIDQDIREYQPTNPE